MTPEVQQTEFLPQEPVSPQEAVPGLASYDHDLELEYWKTHAAGIAAAGVMLAKEGFAPEASVVSNYIIAQSAKNSLERAKTAESDRRATHDRLTNLLNLDGITEVLENLDPDEEVGIVYIDLTNFKAINDLISHDKGDTMLVEVADVFSKSLRRGDFASRIGGDEFMLVIRKSRQGEYQGSHRVRKEASILEEIKGARERIESSMLGVTARHTDVKKHGFGLAIGYAISEPSMTVSALKLKAEEQMMKHKHAQHAELGQHRGPSETTQN